MAVTCYGREAAFTSTSTRFVTQSTPHPPHSPHPKHPPHLPGLSPNHPWLCCLRTNWCAGAQPDDDGGVRSADGELQGRARRAAAEADKADVLR